MIGTVEAIGMYDICIKNNVGGTSELPTGTYRVQVLREFYDYECGQRMVGRLLDAGDILTALDAARTKYGAQDYETHTVYFYGRDFTEVTEHVGN